MQPRATQIQNQAQVNNNPKVSTRYSQVISNQVNCVQEEAKPKITGPEEKYIVVDKQLELESQIHPGQQATAQQMPPLAQANSLSKSQKLSLKTLQSINIFEPKAQLLCSKNMQIMHLYSHL